MKQDNITKEHHQTRTPHKHEGCYALPFWLWRRNSCYQYPNLMLKLPPFHSESQNINFYKNLYPTLEKWTEIGARSWPIIISINNLAFGYSNWSCQCFLELGESDCIRLTDGSPAVLFWMHTKVRHEDHQSGHKLGTLQATKIIVYPNVYVCFNRSFLILQFCKGIGLFDLLFVFSTMGEFLFV